MDDVLCPHCRTAVEYMSAFAGREWEAGTEARTAEAAVPHAGTSGGSMTTAVNIIVVACVCSWICFGGLAEFGRRRRACWFASVGWDRSGGRGLAL